MDKKTQPETEPLLPVPDTPFQFNSPIESPNSDAAAQTSYESRFGTETVSIFIGPERKLFKVYKDLLCKKIKYFDRMFNGSFEEATSGCAYIKEDKPESFGVLLYWVYEDKLPPRSRAEEKVLAEGERGFGFSWNAFEVYNIADRLLLPVLKDMVMDSMRTTSAADGSCTRVEYIPNLYYLAPPNSPSRLYLASLMHWIIVAPHQVKEKDILDALLEYDDLGTHVLSLMRDSNGKPVRDPRTGPNCDFHCHGKNEECSQKKKDGGDDPSLEALLKNAGDSGEQNRQGNGGKARVFVRHLLQRVHGFGS